jgi:hypothetical protein
MRRLESEAGQVPRRSRDCEYTRKHCMIYCVAATRTVAIQTYFTRIFTNIFTDRTAPLTAQPKAVYPSSPLAMLRPTNSDPKQTQVPSMPACVPLTVQASHAVVGRKRDFSSSLSPERCGACRLGEHPLAPTVLMPMVRRRVTARAKSSLRAAAPCPVTRKVTVATTAILL